MREMEASKPKDNNENSDAAALLVLPGAIRKTNENH
jgi:hypothetical protein